MYCDYWNLHKAPFDNVPDPSMYTDCHLSMENVISETITAIKEANEDFAVIIGAVGLGKTLALRIIIESLEPDKYKVVLVTNPNISFVQLLKEIICQITDKPCEEHRKVNLLKTFNHLLFTIMDQGRKLVIFIDEANTLSPTNLENLRLLTNLQDDHRNLFTLVLAGQIELARRLEHSKRTNLFQRIGTYGRIDKLPSEEAVKTYIETRLKLAGTNIKIFSDDCIPAIWEYSEHGVPRLINKICKLCLKAGETNTFDYISADTVLQISETFQKLSKTAVQKRKPRRRPDTEISDIIATENELEEKLLTETIPNHQTKSEVTEPVLQKATELHLKDISPATKHPVTEVVIAKESQPEVFIPIKIEATEPNPEDASLIETVLDKKIQNDSSETSTATTAEVKIEQAPFKNENHHQAEDENYDEVVIGEYKIQLAVPKDILKQVKSFNRESANKSAGFWAAQIIKKNPQLTRSPVADPVEIWNEIKNNILKKITI